MIEKIERYYLEIKFLKDLKSKNILSEKYLLKLVDSKDFQLNKFLYKQIGKKYYWTDRLIWQDKDWIKYLSNKKINTYVLKEKDDLVGYFEVILDREECEIAYFGILEEYFGQGLGGYLLSEAIKICFKNNAKRVWVHTCSLDHPNAIKNYKSRGMEIFKTEVLQRKII